MLGRVLFAVVCVVIAAGLALPLYPSDLGARRSKATDSVLLAADSATAACAGLVITDDGRAACRPDCACGRVLLATFLSVDDDLSVILVIRPQPSEAPSERAGLPQKLPAI